MNPDIALGGNTEQELTTEPLPAPDSHAASILLVQPDTTRLDGIGTRPSPHQDLNGDGITDAARVGVTGMEVPDRIPRLSGLKTKQAAAEERFARMYESDPDGLARQLRDQMAKGSIGDAPHIFATDEAKRMSPDFHPADAGKKALRKARSRTNIAVHQTANALAKRALLQHLDEAIADDPETVHQVLVTAGGCGAGKGRCIAAVPQVEQLGQHATAVWDSAGEQCGTELPWLLEACKQRGCHMTVAYIDRDADDAWRNRVIGRGEKNGRMVDARLFADSYAIGARNMQAFIDCHQDDPDLDILLLDGNSDQPMPISHIPQRSLHQDPGQLARRCAEHLIAVEPSKPILEAGYQTGERIWGPLIDGKEGHAAAVDSDQDFAALS